MSRDIDDAAAEIEALSTALIELYRFVQTEFESEPYGHPLEDYIVDPAAHAAAVRLSARADAADCPATPTLQLVPDSGDDPSSALDMCTRCRSWPATVSGLCDECARAADPPTGLWGVS